MDKISTPKNTGRPGTTLPRPSTISFIRQFARAVYTLPFGAPIVLN